MSADRYFVLGLDLDGTCADFYGRMREIASEWTATPLDELDEEPTWDLRNWGIGEANYPRFHRFAVTQRELFSSMKPLPGAPQAIRRLGTEGIRIRIITHRLFIPYFHQTAVTQTVQWLDHHGLPYWDLCFMREKGDVGADLYVEDSPRNISELKELGKEVIVLSNATNRELSDTSLQRASDWSEAERLIRERYYQWLNDRHYELPPGIGIEPSWAKTADRPVA